MISIVAIAHKIGNKTATSDYFFLPLFFLFLRGQGIID
jgi:hypothetical protein